MKKVRKVQHLFASWRMDYIGTPKHMGCIFCDFPRENADDERFIIHRGNHCFAIQNLYPYNPGHLMIVPFRHTRDITTLTPEEVQEMYRLTATAVSVLQELARPDGFNIGMNLGRTAGAGVADHLHQHIVPRWDGDNNFMPVLSDTRVVPEATERTFAKLKEAWQRHLLRQA